MLVSINSRITTNGTFLQKYILEQGGMTNGTYFQQNNTFHTL